MAEHEEANRTWSASHIQLELREVLMLHFGDYVFLAVISGSVYLVAVRLLDIVRGKTQLTNHTQGEKGNTTGAPR
jgi:hypothetical protein